MTTLLNDVFKLLPLAVLALTQAAQAEEACAKAPAGWTIGTHATSATLCADVLLKADEEGTRKLRVFESGKLAFETDDAALCKTCGGTLGDPFQGIAWKGATLSVSNEGGSRETWGETWKFAQRDKRWVIIGWERNVADRLTLSAWQESVNALTGKAEARYLPGEGECGDAADTAKCKKSDKTKEKKLSCDHPAKSPDAGTVAKWREQAFACGLQTP